MYRLLTFTMLIASLPTVSFAADSTLSGSNGPTTGIAGAVKKPHVHPTKSAKATADDKAKTDAAGARTAGAAINPAKTDPSVSKLNAVLPP